MDKEDIEILVQLGEKIGNAGYIIDDTNKLNTKLVAKPTFENFELTDSNGYALRAAKSFVNFDSPHGLLFICLIPKEERSHLLQAIYYETLKQGKSVEFFGLETSAELNDITDEIPDVLILSETQEWDYDSEDLLEILKIYMSSNNQKRLLVSSDKMPNKTKNLSSACTQRITAAFMVAL